MAVLHIVHRAFATVLFDLFVDAVRHIGFLQQGVSNVLFIGQDIVDDGGRPALYTLCGGNTVLVQLPLDLSQGAAVQIPVVNAADDLRFLRYDLRLSVRPLPVSQHLLVLEGDLSRLRALLLSPRDILAERLGFRLGEAAEQGDEKFAGFREGVDVFLLEVHPNAVCFQEPHRIQTIHRVSGKAGEGLGDDEVDVSPLAGGDHLVELRPFFQAGAGDALIGIDPCHLPVRAVLNLLGVVGLLRLIAVELLFAVRRDAAVGRYAHFSVMVSVQFFRFSGCGDHPHPPL